MNWHQYVEWTDTTAMPSNDGWEALREGLIEECHEALAVWHQIEAVKRGAVKRLHRDGPPNPMQLEVRQTRLDRLRRQLVEEVGDACWYAARVNRLSGGRWTPLVNGDAKWSRTELHLMIEKPMQSAADGDYWAVELLGNLLCGMGVTLTEALANNEAKLLARKAAGTIGGEGDRATCDPVALSADVGNLLDVIRGEMSRTGFVEALIRREAEGRKG